MPPKRFYAVAKGRQTGVFQSWADCQKQVFQFSGAIFKGFMTETDANNFLQHHDSNAVPVQPMEKSIADLTEPPNITPEIEKQKRNLVVVIEKHTPAMISKTKSKSTTINSLTILERLQKQNCPIVYTDGSCLLGKSSGIGVYFGPNNPRNVALPILSPPHTNQRAELFALKKALEIIACEWNPPPKTVIVTDSQYSKNCLLVWAPRWNKNGWKTAEKTNVLNRDIIEPLWILWETLKKRCVLLWVRGHSNIEGNEAADSLAQQGRLMSSIHQ